MSGDKKTLTHDQAIKNVEKNTYGCLGQLETGLNRLSGSQDELAVAIKGGTGMAVQRALTDCYSKGKTLANTLENIVQTLNQVHGNLSQVGNDASQIYFDEGDNGALNLGQGTFGSASSTWADGSQAQQYLGHSDAIDKIKAL